MNTPPLVVGLAGPAGSGKTSVANALAPKSRTISSDVDLVWSHLYFALPLYRMATARQKIQGHQQRSRQCYEIHAAMRELFGATLEYDILVDSVYEISETPIEPEGVKPRSFLQKVGTEICRSLDPDCFVKWMGRKIRSEVARRDPEDGKDLAVIISDIRFPNECEFVVNQPRGVLIRFDVDPAVAQERISKRDYTAPNLNHNSHKSETILSHVSDDTFNACIDTNNLSIEEQVVAVKNVLGINFHPMYNVLKDTYAKD